ncbi:outer membrane beta-barrel protein [Leadbetterella sp. DM7]|uniref:outer membrane beta-barrel protein n=1 Tax=Leadbetterella sp. DM7 TaxID=3235085 RepID=UPI00349EC788
MKSFLWCVVFTSFFIFKGLGVKGQSITTVRLSILDSINHTEVSTAVIKLYDGDIKAVDSIFVDSKGLMTTQLISEKNYRFVITAVGYQTYVKTFNIPSSDTLLNLGHIYLVKDSKILNEVVIKGSRPLIKPTIEGLEYNVSDDPENTTKNLLDILKKVPLLSVNSNEKVLMKGSTDFKFYINGRPAQSLQGNPESVLKSMPASSIKKVEIISHPSSRYDAEGVNGIVNIITKKNLNNGYNGTIGASYDYPIGPGLNGALSIRHGKIAISESVGYNRQHQPDLRQGTIQDNAQGFEVINQEGTKKSRGYFVFSTTEISFDIDTLNLLTASLTYYNFPDRTNSVFNNTLATPGNLQQFYNELIDRTLKLGNKNISLNYQNRFKKNKDATLTTSYNYLRLDNYQSNVATYGGEQNTTQQNYSQENIFGMNEHTGQIDLIYPFKKWSVEGGTKGVFRSNFSESNQNGLTNSTTTPVNTNSYIHDQNILSIYNSYSFKLFSLDWKAGGRLEKTNENAIFKSGDNNLDFDYTNFLPSFILQKNYNKLGTFNLSYNQRIQRPGIFQLNPYVDNSNSLFVSTGNVNLKPAKYHNVDFTYSKYGKSSSFSSSLFFNFTNYSIQYVTYTHQDTITITQPTNSGKVRRIGDNFNYNFSKGRTNFNLNAHISYLYFSGEQLGEDISNNGFTGNIYVYIGYRLNKGYRLSLNLGYSTRDLFLQGYNNERYTTSAAISKSLFDKKAKISLTVNNPWTYYYRNRTVINRGDFTQTNFSDSFNRTFSVNFYYNFGRLQNGVKQNDRTIINDDLKNKK